MKSSQHSTVNASTRRPASRAQSATKRRAPGRSARPTKVSDRWMLRLYVAGQTPRSLTAFANLKQLCEQHLANRYQIEVIDLSRQPHLARADQIVALPTLIRKLPVPIRRLIGDLSDIERVMVGMDLKPRDEGRS